MRLFADTSGLFAAVVRNDCEHQRARPLLMRLLEERAEIHTTSYVVLETMALLHSRVSRDAALSFEQALRPLLKVRWVDEKFHTRASVHLAHRTGAKVSLVDCASFVAMNDEGLTLCLGYDGHFEQEGFELLSSVEDLQTSRD